MQQHGDVREMLTNIAEELSCIESFRNACAPPLEFGNAVEWEALVED